MFIIFRVDDGLTERLRQFPTDNVMYALDKSPAFPSGEQARNCVSQSVLEGRHYDTAIRARQTLHIAQNKRSSYAVRFAGASPCDDNGCVRANKLCQALGLINLAVLALLGHLVCGDKHFIGAPTV